MVTEIMVISHYYTGELFMNLFSGLIKVFVTRLKLWKSMSFYANFQFSRINFQIDWNNYDS